MGFMATCDICKKFDHNVKRVNDPNWIFIDMKPESPNPDIDGLLICAECNKRLEKHYKMKSRLEDEDDEDDDGDDERLDVIMSPVRRSLNFIVNKPTKDEEQAQWHWDYPMPPSTVIDFIGTLEETAASFQGYKMKGRCSLGCSTKLKIRPGTMGIYQYKGYEWSSDLRHMIECHDFCPDHGFINMVINELSIDV